MNNKTYIGIDIGKKGGIFIQSPNIKGLSMKMPIISDEVDHHAVNNILKPFNPETTLVIFERLGPIYGSSKTTAFSMGYQSGALEGICISLNLPYVKVIPKVWQKEMFFGVEELTRVKNGKEVRDTKSMALIAAKRLFPNQDLIFGRATNPNDGVVDAILISEYAKRRQL